MYDSIITDSRSVFASKSDREPMAVADTLTRLVQPRSLRMSLQKHECAVLEQFAWPPTFGCRFSFRLTRRALC